MDHRAPVPVTGAAGEARTAGAAAPVPPEAARLMRRATYASVAVAGLLIGAKLFAWLATDSVSMLSTLLDSVLDAAASMINLVAVRHALTPADREHRFGHGKAEPLAALGQSAFVAGSAVLLIVEVVRRLWRPHPIENGDVGIAVMIGAIGLTVLLVLYQRHVVRRTGSLAISADRLHYLGDVLVNGGVILALVLTRLFGWPLIDPVFGAVIAVYILYTAWSIARSSFDMLMDRELPDEDRQRIRALATAHPEVKAVHELRTRASGPSMFIQFHLEMDGEISLYAAHRIADQVEEEILAVYPGAEVIIHQDPSGIDERRKTFG
jgi:ferrous-iron efflux pump FieF